MTTDESPPRWGTKHEVVFLLTLVAIMCLIARFAP